MADYAGAIAQTPAAVSLVRRLSWLRPASALVGVSSALVAVYVANSPHIDRFGDSPAYELVADGLPRSFISSTRMPGYPVLIALSSLLPGGRDGGLLLTQAVLIVGAVVASYFIARMALGRTWMAFTIAFVIATDVALAGYVRVEMSETLSAALAAGIVISVLKYLEEFRPRYMWVAAAFNVALTLTRPEWAFLPLIVVPYVLAIGWRRGRLSRRVITQAAGSGVAVLIAVAGYCAANLAVNGYFGLSSVSNIALVGKVKVYNMVGEAPPRYASLVPAVQSSKDAWALVLAPPFNDRNSALAGEFARGVVFRDPLRFGQDVMGTAISSLGEHDSQFLNIQPGAPFGRLLQLLSSVGQTRYRAFVILPALAIAWLIVALFARRADYRIYALGLLGLMVLYDWLLTAAGTYGEFERLRMPTNAIETVIVLGTFLLLLRLALTDRNRRIAAVALICFEAAAIGFLPHITSTVPAELALLAVAAVHVGAFTRWSNVLFTDGRAVQAGV